MPKIYVISTYTAKTRRREIKGATTDRERAETAARGIVYGLTQAGFARTGSVFYENGIFSLDRMKHPNGERINVETFVFDEI